MANILDTLANILSTDEIKDFITGKKKPEIDVNTNVEMETETIKNVAFYLFLALAGFAMVLAFLMFWAMKFALSSFKN